MSRLVPREALVEEELYHLIRVVLDKHGSKLNGVEFGKIQPQHSVDGGVADLVLPFADGKHFFVVECKRKITKPSGIQTIRDFDVFGSNVLNQALNYAVRLGTLCFATTNGSRLALFRTPKAGEPFRIDTHRLLVQDPFKLEEKNVEELLNFLSKWHTGAPVRLVEIDWFFISRLRSFVDFLSKSLKPVIKKLASDKVTSKKFEDFSRKVGRVTTEQLTRETAYLLMNKIIFYKILERHYEDLPKLKPISAPDGEYFIKFLKGYFEKAMQVTGDFEPIFITEFYDDIPLPDVDYVLDEVNSFIDEMGTYRLEEVGSDIVGHIYEELIPDEERHKLGQFYTPPPIAELIVKWAVRSSKDVILDPAVGSGTFPVKAYQRLIGLKAEEHKKSREQTDSGAIHREILSQLYTDDINPFPAHLTSMNLAMRNVQYPTSEMNIIVEDFFNLRSRMEIFAPYVIKTPKGEIRRHVTIPTFDAVIANPPYTRGVEITDKTQKSINLSIGELLKKYKLSGGIGKETGIYVHFIMHAYDFLKKHGRLGMIVSNSWLQSDYGISFSNFLLDHFKVKTVIDFNQRLFRIPLVATCVLLLEKEDNPKERSKNKTVFLYLNAEAKVEEILDALDNPEGWRAKFLINIVKQGDLPRDQKWIKKFFDTDEIERAILDSPLATLTNALFEPRYGSILGVSARGGTGADRFFYLSKQDVNKWNIPDAYLSPVLVRSRYSKSFTFTKENWKELKKAGKSCYAFMCHKPRNSLPERVKEFIRWGETTELVRVKADQEPKTAIQSMASMTREKDKKHFFGWYDLGGILKAPIFASRRAQYHHRFVMSKNPDIGIDDGFITFVPKEELSELQLTSALASLNSDIGRFFVEIYGRSTGGGVIELDDKSGGKIPLLNCKKISDRQAGALSDLFNKLETETRQIGEAETQESLERLQPIIDDIDKEIADILGLKEALVDRMREIVRFFFERRVSRTEKASPESVKGEEEPRITPPRKMKKQKRGTSDKQLTKWIEKA
jgi:type I restriction-modification system DNA methylase subunit